MLRTKQAKKLLTKKEQLHLTEVAGIHSMSQMREQVEFLKTHVSTCFECEHIARKLGLME